GPDVLPPAAGPPRVPTLSLHDALPISASRHRRVCARDWRDHGRIRDLQGGAAGTPAVPGVGPYRAGLRHATGVQHLSRVVSQTSDRKSTRLNSSHVKISYAVFCLKKKT